MDIQYGLGTDIILDIMRNYTYYCQGKELV